jgi:hypothetical protein
MAVYAVNTFSESGLKILKRFFARDQKIICGREGDERKTNKNSFIANLTVKFGLGIYSVDSTVDKLSNIRKHNFFYFLVDKTDTIVVYFVHEVNKTC